MCRSGIKYIIYTKYKDYLHEAESLSNLFSWQKKEKGRPVSMEPRISLPYTQVQIIGQYLEPVKSRPQLYAIMTAKLDSI